MGLNEKQKEAVEYLEGPLLVLAGPGTGKTQLLSEKVAYILKNVDVSPENILCLTFTESGMHNMKERMRSMIGVEALKVNVGTYHAFGQEILAQYKNFSPDYTRLIDQAIDGVAQFKIIKKLQADLPARDILAGDRIKDIMATIGEAKAADLLAADLAKIAAQNIEDAKVLSSAISPLLENVVPRVYKASYENAYLPIYEILQKYEDLPPIVGRIERSIAGMARDLKKAMDEAVATERVKPLTNWKDAYFERNDQGEYRLKDRVANLKMASLAVVMQQYQDYLEANGLYDFNDMIIEAVRALKSDKAFKQTMQEKYQYIMLDEFQDTNPTQLAIIKELTDYEKPLIMAVGDDDQAIYEFQGASSTNLTDFQEYYGAHVVTLTENYRSTQEVLDFAKQIIDQADNRFVNEKPLKAHKATPDKTQIHRMEFLSSDQEYAYVADKIAELIISGVKQSDIAIISSKHKYFQPLLPYLKSHPEIKIAYEKRDNLFDDEKIHELLTVLKLADEISKEKKPTVSMLEILAYPWMGVNVMETVRLVAEAREAHKPVFDYLLTAKTSEAVGDAMQFLAELIGMALNTPLEIVFSKVTEKMQIETLEPAEMFRFYENLASLRAKLIKYVGEKPLRVADLIQMADDYAEAEMQLITTSPYRDADEAIQVMSAHKAKGLEFDYVFIISADHTAWGKGKGNNNFLVPPKNLIQIRHTGTTDGEQIRLLYVALTRAKHTLYITNSVSDFNGKTPVRLEYFDEHAEKMESGAEQIISPFLPFKKVLLGYTDSGFQESTDGSAVSFSADKRAVLRLKNYLQPFTVDTPDMRSIYKERVKNYRMSPTSLTSFIDIAKAGPEDFFRKNILRAEMEPEDEYLALGNLAHATFEQITNTGISDEAAMDFYLSELEKRDLPNEMKARIREKGPAELAMALKAFSKVFRAGKAEVDLGYEHLVINGVPVTGKIDHLLIDDENKTIEVYDFKNRKYSKKDTWTSNVKLYKYAMQLEFYKILLNNSPTYRKYKVERAHILFVKPDDDNEVHDKIYNFKLEEETKLLDLMQAVYNSITTLKFMDDPEIFIAKDESRGTKDINEFVELLIEKFKGLE